MKRALALLAALVCALVLCACAGQGSLSSEIVDETGAYKVTADDAGKGSAVASLGGGIEVADGQALVAESDIEKGSLQLRLLDSAGDVVLDEKMDGKGRFTYELDPDDYSVSATCNEDGTTGTLLVMSVDAEK